MKLIRSISGKYLVLGLLLLLMLGAHTLYAFRFAQDIQHDSHISDLLGAERARLYRIGINLQGIATDGNTDRARFYSQLKEEVAMFWQVLYALRDGSTDLNLPPLKKHHSGDHEESQYVDQLILYAETEIMPHLNAALDTEDSAENRQARLAYLSRVNEFEAQLTEYAHHFTEDNYHQVLLFRQMNYLLLVLSLLMLILIAFYVRRNFVWPILQLKKVSEEVRAGHLTVRSTLDQNDEVGDFSDSLNHMINALEISVTNKDKILSIFRKIYQASNVHAASGDALQKLLAQLAEEGRQIVGARYGAIAIFDDQSGFELFIPAGLEPAQFEEMKRNFGTPRGKGLFRHLREHPNEVLRIESIKDHPASEGLPEGHPPLKAFLGVPLTVQQRYVGQLYLADRQDGHPFSEDDEAWAINFGQFASQAIQNAKLFENTIQQKKKLEIIHRVTGAVASGISPVEVAKSALGAVLNEKELKITDKGAIFLHDGAGKRVVMLAENNFPQFMKTLCQQVPYGDCLCGLAAETGRPFYCHNCLQDDIHNRRLPEMKEHGHVVLPLQVQNQLIGVLCLYREAGHQATDQEKNLFATLASIIAVALENALHTDTLEQKVQERTAALELSRNEAEAANRAKSAFLANMSHELRTPLNAVIGFSDLLYNGMAGDLTEDQMEYVNDIKGSGNHLLKLINEILDLSKIEAGKMEFTLAEVEVVDIINTSLMFIREKTLKHSIQVELVVDEGVGSITADETRLKQALVNLLANAAKFSPDQGTITVTARRLAAADLSRRLPAAPSHPAMTAAEYLLVSVADSGRGISAEDLQKLFQPFFQAGSVLQGKTEGTGLGLALSRRIIEQHGGWIWAASEGEGHGAEFSFVLPYAEQEHMPLATDLQGREVSWPDFLEYAVRLLAYHRRESLQMGICSFFSKEDLAGERLQEFCQIMARETRTYEIVVTRHEECLLVLLDVDEDKMAGAVNRFTKILTNQGFATEVTTVLFPDDGDTIEELMKGLKR